MVNVSQGQSLPSLCITLHALYFTFYISVSYFHVCEICLYVCCVAVWLYKLLDTFIPPGMNEVSNTLFLFYSGPDKYIVCKDQLMALFTICPACCSESNGRMVQQGGTFIKIKQVRRKLYRVNLL